MGKDKLEMDKEKGVKRNEKHKGEKEYLTHINELTKNFYCFIKISLEKMTLFDS